MPIRGEGLQRHAGQQVASTVTVVSALQHTHENGADRTTSNKYFFRTFRRDTFRVGLFGSLNVDVTLLAQGQHARVRVCAVTTMMKIDAKLHVHYSPISKRTAKLLRHATEFAGTRPSPETVIDNEGPHAIALQLKWTERDAASSLEGRLTKHWPQPLLASPPSPSPQPSLSVSGAI